jgi:hypothetical protein
VRTALALRSEVEPNSRAYPVEEKDETFFADRKYFGSNTRYGSRPNQGTSRAGKKCFVCKKPNCWSTRHTPEERQKAYGIFRKFRESTDKDMSKVIQYVTKFEGLEPDIAEDYEHFVDEIAEIANLLANHVTWSDHFITTSYGVVDRLKAIELLN